MLLVFVTVLAAAVAAFLGLYVVARRIENFGIVDVAWSAGFIPVALAYAVAGPAPLLRRVTLVALVAVWSGRLAWHLGRRVARLHPCEDGRYLQLRREWERGFDWKMGGFFGAQALVLGVLSWPFLAIAWNRAPAPSLLEVVGLAIVAFGVGGEATADAQLTRFQRTHGAPAVCDVGLWHLSRHPNYFFESLVWIGWAVAAWPAPGGHWAFVCPVFMLWLLLRVTGVGPTEEHLERTRGAAYRAYRARTSAFVPWFPRRAAANRMHGDKPSSLP